MEFLSKLEKTVLGWFRGMPNLPVSGQKWLADNIWWIVLIGAILTALGVLAVFGDLMRNLSLLDTPAARYSVSSNATSWVIITAIVSLVFSVIEAIILAVSIQPLKEKQRRGWVLLFVVWLLSALGVVVSAVLSGTVAGFIISILFGAVWAGISGYFLFQVHGQFAHVERSRGVRGHKTEK